MISKLTKIYKLMTVGSSVGIIIKKDDLEQMRLKKGDIVKITLEKAVEIVAKNKMISKPKMIKLLAALGMDYLTMTLEKVTEGFKMLVPMNLNMQK